MITRDEYIKSIQSIIQSNSMPEWSAPMYQCPQCGGAMRKNLINCICITTIPPSYQYTYRCDQCSFTEILNG